MLQMVNNCRSCIRVCAASCPYLHHNIGDTERHYHLRYYKTEKCLYPATGTGVCSKNGQHCMFAHGHEDLRDPVYDLTLQAEEHGTNLGTGMGTEKNTIESEQMYHLDPQWAGKFLPSAYLYRCSPCIIVYIKAVFTDAMLC